VVEDGSTASALSMGLTHSLAVTGVVLLIVAATYAALSLFAALVWQLWPRRRTSASRPPVTILKPLCGADPGLHENLRSFCRQDYPALQIVFGVRDAADPALATVQQVMAEYPALQFEVVVDESQHGSNRKISNLINMLPFARHEILVIADSDVRVSVNYLNEIVPLILNPRVGLVTCIYRSVPIGGVWSRLGSMYINEWYMPSVVLAWLFGYNSYASGQTMGLRRATLKALGGLRTVVNHLADDHEVGQQVHRLGMKIVLAHYVPEALQYEPRARALAQHELRWMRTIRALAPVSFCFLFVSFTWPLVGAALALMATEPGLSARLSAFVWTALVCRTGICCLPHLMQRRLPVGELCLSPLRDALLCYSWLRALSTSRINWRGGEFVVKARGVMRSSS
jgi:ceramide glucosyltransferase